MDARNNSRPDEDGEIAAPPKLVAALKQLQPQRVFVPPAVDGAVLNAARRQFAKPDKTGIPTLRRWLAWPVFATACVMAALLVHRFTKPVFAPDLPDFAREDVNHDGRVDILDAFQLARQLQSGQKPVPALDLNGDGSVDRRDAEAIAAHAVKLEKGGRS